MTIAELQKLAGKLEVELLNEAATITFPSGVEWDDIYAIWYEGEDMCVLRKKGTIHKFAKAWASVVRSDDVEANEISVQETSMTYKPFGA